MQPDPNVLLRSDPCPECGETMLWTQNVWAHGDSRAAAYQCANGHILDPKTTHECPACGVHDTKLVGSGADGRATHVCNKCGERFELVS